MNYKSKYYLKLNVVDFKSDNNHNIYSIIIKLYNVEYVYVDC